MNEAEVVALVAGAVSAGLAALAILKRRSQAVAVTVLEAAGAGVAAVLALVVRV